MNSHELVTLAQLRKARDGIDRDFAHPLDVPTMAQSALMSPAHFSRQFKAAYGETPYGYLMTRRIERAMALLRAGSSVTDACMAVGCTSLGSFSSSFTSMTGETPSAYRNREHRALEAMPACIARLLTRPLPARAVRAARAKTSRIGEVRTAAAL
jgi:AraC-like DNA-binding protein